MRAPILFLLMTLLLDSIGIGLILPVMPDLIREVQGGSDLAKAALWGGVLSTTFAVMQFLFSPLIGNLSDRFGRRPVLLVSLVVMSLDYLLMAVAGTMWLLLLGRVIGGITSATYATAYAYIADISKPEDKAANFGLLGAALGLGFVLGPLLGGVLAEFGTRAPFLAAATLAGLNAIYGAVVLKETVTDQIRRPFSWHRSNPLGALKHLSALPGLGRLLLVYFIERVAITVYPAVWSYYTIARFGWSPGMIGLSLAIYGVSLAVVQGVLIRPALRLLGERRTVIWGIAIGVVMVGAVGIVPTGFILLALTPLAALPDIATPALQGLMSKAVQDDAQGELQGALTSAQALAMIIAPLVMTSTFAAFSGPEATVVFPGAPFALAGLMMMLALWVFLKTQDWKDKA